MTAGGGRDRRLWMLVGVTVVLGGLAGGVGLLARDGGDENGAGLASASQIEAYEDAVIRPLQRGGSVVERGMKPEVQRLGQGEASGATFQAISWVNELDAVRREVAAVKTPSGLEQAGRLFDEALRLYREAAETLGAAAIATGEPRQKLLSEAVAKARRADDVYDDASEVLQRARLKKGLPLSDRFPKPKEEQG